jgi:hypothetical protein
MYVVHPPGLATTPHGPWPSLPPKERDVRAFIRITLIGLVVPALVGIPGSDASAQISFEAGLKGGAGFTSLGGTGLTQSNQYDIPLGNGDHGMISFTADLGDTKTGLVAGAYLTARFHPRFALRIEALSASRGSKGKNSGSIEIVDAANTPIGSAAVSGENIFTVEYFEIPLLAVARFPFRANGAFEVFAGPSFASRGSAKIEQTLTLTGDGESQSATDTQDLSDQIASTDLGGVAGVGYTHRAGVVIWSVDARWTQGFRKVDDSGVQDWMNRGLSLMVGLGAALGGAKP